MPKPRRTLILTLLSCLASLRCGPAEADVAAPAGPPAQAVTTTTPAVVDPAAALRRQGRPALDRLLARYDQLPAGAARAELATLIDRVAGQRYATTSRLYWHTDLAAAQAEARATGRPILSLRMLGRLDEDLSCANSRYFRIALYANAAVSAFLRDRFVLHWSSERPVPRITVDFGDGRVIERTITGNSAHYVLDADGRPIDVLPGLYAPVVFQRELTDTLALSAALAGTAGPAREAALAEHHRARLSTRRDEFRALGQISVPARGDDFRPAAFAQVATITKSGLELPDYRVVDFGVDVGPPPDDAAAWAQVGLRLQVGAPAVPPVAAEGRGPRLRLRTGGMGVIGGAMELRPGPPPEPVQVLDARSRGLLAALAPLDWASGQPANVGTLARLVVRFERDLLADTAVNEYQVRPQLRGQFINAPGQSFEQLGEYTYREVFKTPKDDPWLGLAPAGVTALPADGLRR